MTYNSHQLWFIKKEKGSRTLP